MVALFMLNSVNDTVAINMFISNGKKHKCQGMSKHLKDPKNTLDPRRLSKIILLTLQPTNI